jgi:flavin reductase (DIM6/NTAB) family NADH-FMN oxidoreductase RutF
MSPPLVLWSLANSAASLSDFRAVTHYAINVLSITQKDLALQFASRTEDRFARVQFSEGAGGAPIIQGSVASFECFNRSRYDEGDHVIFVGEVEQCHYIAGAAPLLFHGGKFFTEHPL